MNEPHIIIEFAYRPHRFQLIALTVLVAAGGVLSTYFALTLDGPVDVIGFQLSMHQGRIFFGIIACLSPISIAVLLCGLWVSVFHNRRVALSSRSIFLPAPSRSGLSCREIEIPFASIDSVQLCDFIGNCKLIRMEHSGGVTCIPSNMIGGAGRFAQLYELIVASASKHRAR